MSWQGRAKLFFLSQAITLFGSTLSQMAIVWYVTLETASGAWVAGVTVCGYLPQFLLSWPGGVWADRYDRKGLILGADGMIAGVTLAVLFYLPRLSQGPHFLALLLLLSALRSVGAGVQTPAVSAVVPQLVPKQARMQYNGLNAAMQAAVQFAAPAGAGVLLSLGPLSWALATDVITGLLGMGLLAFLPLPRGGTEALPGRARLRDGYAAVLSRKPIRRLLALYGLFVFLTVPGGFLAQLLVRRIFGDSYWYLTAAEVAGFAGMALGGLLMSTWGGFSKRSRTLRVGLAAFGLLSMGLGAAPWFPWYLCLMVLFGVALTTVQTALTTLLQDLAAPAVQGRVFGLMGALYAGALPLGMAVFGPLADVLPLPWLMAAAGLPFLFLSVKKFPIDRQFML